MRTILIFDTALATSNVGDDIIMDAIDRNMREVFDSGFSMRLATHVDNYSPLQLMKPIKKIGYFQNADLKFICGTNLIQQKRLGKIHCQWALYPHNVSLYTGSILVGVGTTDGGTRLDPLAEMLYRKVLSRNYIHSVRDELTKEIVNHLGFRAINTGCPTLWEMTPEKCREIPTGKASSCVISVSGYDTQKDPARDRQMLEIVSQNYRQLTAWIQTSRDEEYLDSFPGTQEIRRIYNLKQYRELLRKEAPDYVGTRLHGGVFALQNNCRSIVISIDHRAEGFQKSNNLPVVKRERIGEDLERMINSDWKTEIRINEKAIKKFKGQF